MVRAGLPEGSKPVAARLFWEAFSAKLGLLMRPDEKALRWLEDVVDPDYAFGATKRDGGLVGVAGFKTIDGAFIGGTLGDMAKHYGWFGGTWRGLMLGLLERETVPGQLLMDGIFVDAAARGLGVGTALLDGIKAEAARRNLDEVRLDVIDANPRARALYERQGFVAGKTSHLGPLRHLFGFQSATTMVFSHTREI
jgi:ribosomal protein S18 acetylase RimI-like enzyme